MNATETPIGNERNRRGKWAAIEREILDALSQTELSIGSRRHLKIESGPTGIVLTGEVLMGWERELVKAIAHLHNHGMPVFNELRVYCQSTAPFAEEPAEPTQSRRAA